MISPRINSPGQFETRLDYPRSRGVIMTVLPDGKQAVADCRPAESVIDPFAHGHIAIGENRA